MLLKWLFYFRKDILKLILIACNLNGIKLLKKELKKMYKANALYFCSIVTIEILQKGMNLDHNFYVIVGKPCCT